jgi:hypothetical protein
MYYQIQEGYFTLEGEWQDRSVNLLAAMHLPVAGANLVVTREALPPGMGFHEYLTQQKKGLEKELSGFELLADNQESLERVPARFLEFSWKNQGAGMHQMLLVLDNGDQVLTLTATVPGDLNQETRDALLAAMMSFRFGIRQSMEEDGPR